MIQFGNPLKVRVVDLTGEIITCEDLNIRMLG